MSYLDILKWEKLYEKKVTRNRYINELVQGAQRERIENKRRYISTHAEKTE